MKNRKLFQSFFRMMQLQQKVLVELQQNEITAFSKENYALLSHLIADLKLEVKALLNNGTNAISQGGGYTLSSAVIRSRFCRGC